MIEQDEINLVRALMFFQHDPAFQYKNIAGSYPLGVDFSVEPWNLNDSSRRPVRTPELAAPVRVRIYFNTPIFWLGHTHR